MSNQPYNNVTKTNIDNINEINYPIINEIHSTEEKIIQPDNNQFLTYHFPSHIDSNTVQGTLNNYY